MLREANAEAASPTELRQVCAELERRLGAGEAYQAETVFAAHPEFDADDDAALEVIYTEFVAREQLGQRPARDDFYVRFPRWRESLKQLFQIHGAVGDGNFAGPSSLTNTPFPDEERWRRQTEPGFDGVPRRIGNYVLLGEVGRGGMGVVYKARQLGLNRLVALKMILTGADAGPQERALLRAEAEAAARLQHPNIVQIHEVGEHDGRPFLSLEYVDGGSLEKILTGTPWPAAASARLVQTLAQAMQHAHQQGIVHRDLKPANILLSGAGRGTRDEPAPDDVARAPAVPFSALVPKIADFGLSRRLRAETLNGRSGPELTAVGAIVGTPAYMAPEQAAGDGQDIGPTADVYALGTILYELLTGRPPFQGVHVLETLEQVRSRDPVPPSRLLPGLARDIETVCLKCLEKDPGRRYGGAAALADDLGRFLRGEPVRARPTTAWEKTWKWAKRRPAVAGLLAVVVVLMIVGLASVTLLWRQTAAALSTAKLKQDETEAALASKLIALAHRDWLANDLDQARRHLDECPSVHRDQEWRYLHQVCNSCLYILHDADVKERYSSLAWGPDGRYLAAGAWSFVAKVWDSLGGGECFTLPGKQPSPTVLGFQRQGHLVSVTWQVPGAPAKPKDPRPVHVKLWDVGTRQEARGFITSMTRYQKPVLSGDARRLAVGDVNDIHVIDTGSGEKVASVPHCAQNAIKLTLSGDGRILAWVRDGRDTRVWDTAVAASLGPAIKLDADATVLVLSPKGDRLVVVPYNPNQAPGLVRIYNCRTGKLIMSLVGHANPVECVAFSPDGRCLATGSADRAVIVWDLDTGKELFTLRGHLKQVYVVEFSPDGTRLASTSGDLSVRIWDARPLADRND